MAAIALPARPLAAGLPFKIAAALTIAAVIAAVEPFDRAFAAVTFGIPALRAALIVALAAAGAIMGQRVGFNFGVMPGKRTIVVSFVAAILVAIWCAGIDVSMRPVLQPGYLRYVTTIPLGERLLGYTMRAFNENIMYRLFLSSLLAWVLGMVWHSADGRPTVGAFCAAIVIAQMVNIGINITILAPVTTFSLLHDALRYVAPGVVWGWLYWRYGFQSNEIACTSVHIVLQPLLSLGFA